MFETRYFNQEQSAMSNSQKTEDNGYQRKIVPYQKREKFDSDNVELGTDYEIEKILGRARSSYVVNLIEKGDELTEEDLEIIAEVQKNIEEEKENAVAQETSDAFVCSMSKCYITGCEVHTLTPNFIHYGHGNAYGCASIGSMSPRQAKGYEYYKAYPDCSYIEVYERHICVVGYNGATQVFNE